MSPCTLYAPLTLACDSVRLLPPVLLTCTGKVWELPTCTPPKLKVPGESVNCPCVEPAPDRATVAETKLLDPLLPFTPREDAVAVTTTVPATVFADCGTKVTFIATLCPAFNLIGRLSPLVEKPSPLRVTCVIFRAVVPEFESVAASVWDVPTGIAPKLREVGVADSLITRVPLSVLPLVPPAATASAGTSREDTGTANASLQKMTRQMMKNNFASRLGRASRNVNL